MPKSDILKPATIRPCALVLILLLNYILKHPTINNKG